MSLNYAYINHTVKRGVNTLRKTIKRYKNKNFIGGTPNHGDTDDTVSVESVGNQSDLEDRSNHSDADGHSPGMESGGGGLPNTVNLVDGGDKANVIEGQHVKDRIIYTIKITVPGTIPQCIEKGD
jgi:hypothetical protein